MTVLCSHSLILIGFLSYLANFWGDHSSWGPNFLGAKFPGDQISWGPNFLGTKFLGDQISRGPNFLGTKFLRDQKGVGTKFLGPKFLGDQISWGPKNSGDQMGLGTNSVTAHISMYARLSTNKLEIEKQDCKMS